MLHFGRTLTVYSLPGILEPLLAVFSFLLTLGIVQEYSLLPWPILAKQTCSEWEVSFVLLLRMNLSYRVKIFAIRGQGKII